MAVLDLVRRIGPPSEEEDATAERKVTVSLRLRASTTRRLEFLGRCALTTRSGFGAELLAAAVDELWEAALTEGRVSPEDLAEFDRLAAEEDEG